MSLRYPSGPKAFYIYITETYASISEPAYRHVQSGWDSFIDIGVSGNTITIKKGSTKQLRGSVSASFRTKELFPLFGKGRVYGRILSEGVVVFDTKTIPSEINCV